MMFNKLLPAFAAILIAIVAFFFVVCLTTIFGYIIGWVIGGVFSNTFAIWLEQLGMSHFTPGEIGAGLAFIGSFFKQQTNINSSS